MAIVLISILLLGTRLAYAVPAALVALMVACALATPKANEADGPLLPRGRLLFIFPATLWFLCLLVADMHRRARPARINPQVAVAMTLVLCAVSAGLRLIDNGPREHIWYTKAVALGAFGTYGFQPRPTVADRCAADLRAAGQSHSGLIVYRELVWAYACAPSSPKDLVSIVPIYERRTWLLYPELTHPRTRLIVSDVDPSFCDVARQRAVCEWEDRRAVLSFPPQPALPLLASLGIQIRAFGPHCRPLHLFGTTYCADGVHGADLTRHPLAPGPKDADGARHAITGAYLHMFDLSSDGANYPNVEMGNRFSDVTRALRALPAALDGPVVTGVRFIDDHEATTRVRVGPTILSGEAVVEDGAWRVAVPTFCRTAQIVAGLRGTLLPCNVERFYWSSKVAR